MTQRAASEILLNSRTNLEDALTHTATWKSVIDYQSLTDSGVSKDLARDDREGSMIESPPARSPCHLPTSPHVKDEEGGQLDSIGTDTPMTPRATTASPGLCLPQTYWMQAERIWLGTRGSTGADTSYGSHDGEQGERHTGDRNRHATESSLGAHGDGTSARRPQSYHGDSMQVLVQRMCLHSIPVTCVSPRS